jgi:hypothetical protein
VIMNLGTLFRAVGAVVVALLAVFALVIAVELFSALVHPTPPGFQGTHDEMCAHVANYPVWVLGVVVPMWAGIAFLGTWLAGRWGNSGSVIFVALLLLAAVLFNTTILPYPVWFKVVQPLAVMVSVILGYSWSRRRLVAAG